MSSLYNLSSVLIELESELRSTKVLIRTKALTKFQQIVDNRTEDLNQLLNTSQIHGKTNWLNLFETIHESCIQQTNRLEDCQGQKTLQATENKNSEYSNVIKKLVNLANKDQSNIPISLIIEKSFHCFGNRWMCRYFGIAYLQTIQLNVLNCDRDRLEDVRATEWSKLLSYCFIMYKMDTIDKFVILQCFTPIIEKGVLYTQLTAELPQYLPILRTIAAGNPEFNALTELIKTIYAFSSNLALDYRLAVCDFLEDTLGIILKSFGTRMSDDAKIIFFKLLNLAIVIHHPLGGDGQSGGDAVATKTHFIAKPDLWYRHLRNIFHLIQTQIKQMSVQINRFQTNSLICEYFVTLGASLCSVIFWNSDILREPSVVVDDDTNNEPNRKRPRYYSQKIQGIMDLIDLKDGKFCWRWMAILAKVLIDHQNECMSIDDHQPLLQMLHDFQLTIQFPYQVKILTNICQILLDLEPTFLTDSSQLINPKFCDDLWFKIIQTAFRTQTANNAMFLENIRLIQLLILKKSTILPNSFILTIVRTFLNHSIPKLNEIATLLIIIFKYTNIDSLGDGDSVELRHETLKWLHLMDLKQVLRLDSEVISIERVAELSILCLFSKIDLSNINRNNLLNDNSINEYTKTMKELKQNLLYKSMNYLLVFTEIDNESSSVCRQQQINLPQPNALKSIINENMFEKLYEILNPDKEDIPTTDNAFMDLKKIIPSLVSYLQMLNQLILYEALDRDRVEKTFLAKKIHFKLEQYELCIGRLFADIQMSNSPTDILSEKDLFNLLNEIQTIFNPNLHTEIRQSIILTHSFRSTIVWLKQQINNIPVCQNSHSIMLYKRNDLDKMLLSHRIKYKLFMLVIFFMDTDEKGAENQVEAFSIISEYPFNLKSISELFCVFEIIEMILEQKSTVNKADWVFNQIKSLCQIYHRNQQISERIFELIPALAKFIKIYPQMTDDMIILLSTYLAKKKFGQHITCKLINTLKWIAREYSDEYKNEGFTLIFQFLSKFLIINDLKIQYKTINVLCHVFDSNWIYGSDCKGYNNEICETVEQTRISLKKFHEHLFEKLEISKLITILGDTNDNDDNSDAISDIDRSSRLISVSVQLFSGLIYKNYILQQKNWFLLAEFCYKKELNQDLIVRVVRLLSEKFQIQHAALIKENIFYLLSMWLVKNYQMAKFPWFITTSKTQSDFFYDNIQMLTISMLRNRPNLLENFVPLMSGETMLSMIKPVLPNCLAYMLPMFAECKMPTTYLAKSKEMLKIIQQTFPNISDLIKNLLLEVLENLTKNLWDEKMFDNFFKTNVDYISEDYMIDSIRFDQCLNYLMKTINSNGSQKIFNELSLHEPYKMFLLLTSLKSNLQQNTNFIEQKLVYLFHYFAIVDRMITDLFSIESFSVKVKKETVSLIKRFFIQDIIYFVCNLLLDNEMIELRLKQASCKYFLKFSKQILPKCSAEYSPHLNYIVSAFLPLMNQPVAKQYHGVPMELLKFLIIDMRPVLENDIALLDKFPNDEIFTELRSIHFDVKYKGNDFSLIDELTYFLQINKRNIEGFAALRKHLSEKKDELREIYQQHEQMTEENYENSQLHRLTIALLIAVQSGDMAKSQEAVKCLGELGPTSLSSIVLKPDSQLNTYNYHKKFENATKNLCQVIIQKLNSLLLHSDTRVLQATASALVFLLNYKFCQELAAEYPQLVIFKSQNPNKTLIYTSPNRIAQKLIENIETIFIEEEFSIHSIWIKRFTIELLEIFGDTVIKEIVALQTDFTESILPLLTQMLLTCEKGLFHEMFKHLVEQFFHKHFDLSNNSGDLADKYKQQSIYMNHASIKSMLNIAECIRIHNIHELNNQIILNNLHIAKAAQFCNAYFTSILYGDLWVLEQNATAKDNNTCSSDPTLQNVMKESYTAIGHTDAIITFIDPIVSRHQYLEYKHAWNQIVLERDTLSYSEQNNIEMSKQYLISSGLYGLSHCLRKNVCIQQYECAWRLCDWSQIDELTTKAISATANTGILPSHHQSQLLNDNLIVFEKQHYAALRCLQMKDEIGVNAAINMARSAIISALRNASLECTNNLYVHLMRLALIQQIEDFCHIQFSKADQQFENIFDKWRNQDRIGYIDFNYKEPMLAQRMTIFKSAGLRAIRKLKNTFNVRDDMLSVMILQMARCARIEGNSNLAIRYLAALRETNKTISNEVKANLLLEDAQLNWHLGDQILAKKLLDISLKNGDIESSLSRAVGLRIFGEYHAESQSKNVKFIIDKFFQPSLKLIDNIELSKVALADRMKITGESLMEFCLFNRIEAYQMIGRYADSEYCKIQSYIKSPEFERKKERISRSTKTADEMDNVTEMSKELKTARIILSRNAQIDRNEIKSTETELCEYLMLALSNYVKVCQLRDDDDLTVNIKSLDSGDDCLQQRNAIAGDSAMTMFRIISLWFSNKHLANVNEHLMDALKLVASHKFMTVLPQVVVRISNDDCQFSQIVCRIVERCAIDHPQHTIYQILALANAYADDSSQLGNSPEPRTLGAKNLIEKLSKNKKISIIISQMKEMCDALILFANKQTETNTIRISSKESISKLRNLNMVHCPTLNLSISKSGKYLDQMITVVKWSEQMSMVGGINAPKKISCICSNGREYPQLLKGKDDMRQDAIMQQVFTILNKMLRANKIAKERKLNVKTYKVVPLSNRSGILEWCSNSIPLNVYLVGQPPKKQGAHERYHPNDLKPSQCRKAISKYNQERQSLKIKIEIFEKICSKFQPAFQYFFFEKFHNPGEWFERRLAYTNSVATTSMIGYILGIGDRHVSNILIDEKTAELIHIDFGIAFEQAKCLPTPETIPFRLTRDMVAAFGVSGVDGIFRKSCEKTMEVLRHNKTTIMTILEVLLFDPLYAWALTNKKAYSHQDIDIADDEIGEQKNTMAERALARLEAKLNGEEEGMPRGGTTTIEAQVELLISQARSVKNLCALFEGWQAYL